MSRPCGSSCSRGPARSAPTTGSRRRSTGRERSKPAGRSNGVASRRGNKQVVLGDGKSGRSDRGRETLEKIEAFESWAAGRNASLYPFFEERTRGSLLTDRAETVVVLPVLCLTIYEGERLEAMFPRMVDDVSYTVQEGLGALEADDGVSGPLGLGIEGGESERA